MLTVNEIVRGSSIILPQVREGFPGEELEGKKRGSLVILLMNDVLGGDHELGKVLIKNFLYALVESVPPPKALIFVNVAVRLVCEGSDIIESLRALSKQGAQLLVCSTSLNYYKLRPVVGLPTNMYEIVEMLLKADKVLSI